jgi:hypothetical protein
MIIEHLTVDGPRNAALGLPVPVTAGADLRQSYSKSVVQTLTTASTVYTTALPSGIRGVILYPTVADTWFAIGENPAAANTVVGNVAANQFVVGQLAPFGLQTVRILDDVALGASPTLRLVSATANANVTISTF